MTKKNKPDSRGFVYSTDPGFRFDDEQDEKTTRKPAEQKLKIRLDTKQRAGKAVTLVEGFEGNSADLGELGKKLKAFCGTGGSVKEGEILIQGDHCEKIMNWFLKNGYTGVKKI